MRLSFKPDDQSEPAIRSGFMLRDAGEGARSAGNMKACNVGNEDNAMRRGARGPVRSADGIVRAPEAPASMQVKL